MKLPTLSRIGEMATAALDASVMIHDVANVVDTMHLLDGNFVPFLEEYLRRLYKLVQQRISVVVVFDGAPNPHKQRTDDSREGHARPGDGQAPGVEGHAWAGWEPTN